MGDVKTIFSDNEIENMMIRVEGGTRIRVLFKPSGIAETGAPGEYKALLMRVKVLTLLKILDLEPSLLLRYPELARWSKELRLSGGQAAAQDNIVDGLTDRTYLSLLSLVRCGTPALKDSAASNHRLLSDPLGRALLEGEFDDLIRGKRPT